jgi:oleate hydratase
MKFYDRVNASKPKDIEKKNAHIVGGGIAGMAAAAFLAVDGHMPPENITVYEQRKVVGGSMDGEGNAETGYVNRGERELEAYMECLWYLFGKVPSLRNPRKTVLDEIYYFNREEPIRSHGRLLHNCGQIVPDYHDRKMNNKDKEDWFKLLITPEEELDDMRIDDWFKPSFFKSNEWRFFSTMLSFKEHQSLIETKRYLTRFLHLGPRIDYLEGIIHTEYNEWDAMIKPLLVWLEDMGVNFRTDTEVTDVQLDEYNNTVVALELDKNEVLKISKDDLVFITNGSMTQNTTYGDNDTVAILNRDTENRGCFTLWENLAKKDEKFGHPEKFISNPDATSWISFFPTITDYPKFVEYIEDLTEDKAGTGGCVTINDSNWLISFVLHHKPFYPNQPVNVEVFWAYGLYGENEGNYIKKPMAECTGNEIMTELIYHLGLIDKKDEILAHCSISTAMMPYIMSQFMPRTSTDRPQVIPEGCTNLAFIGQFVEIPGDVVFTVETSVRTAMQAVYGLLELDKPVIEVYPTSLDLRYILASVKTILDVDDLGKGINPIKLMSAKKDLKKVIENIPDMPQAYTGKD